MKLLLAGILVVVLFVRDMLSRAEDDYPHCDEARYSWATLSIVSLVLIGALALTACHKDPATHTVSQFNTWNTRVQRLPINSVCMLGEDGKFHGSPPGTECPSDEPSIILPADSAYVHWFAMGPGYPVIQVKSSSPETPMLTDNKGNSWYAIPARDSRVIEMMRNYNESSK